MVNINNSDNNPDREQIWTLMIGAIDNLERMARARELTNIIWDINVDRNRTEQDWIKTEILLESYEKMRDESLEAAFLNLQDLVQIMSD